MLLDYMEIFLRLQKANISDEESIIIFNIDTFRPNFSLPTCFDIEKVDGYLETFEADGDQWSFVLPEDEKCCKVKRIQKKEFQVFVAVSHIILEKVGIF